MDLTSSENAILWLYLVPAILTLGQGLSHYFCPPTGYDADLVFYVRAYELCDWYTKPIGISFPVWYFVNLILATLLPVVNWYSYYEATGWNRERFHNRVLNYLNRQRCNLMKQGGQMQ